MSKELLSFVVPCYRSEKTIEGVVAEIIERCGEKSELYDYEIVLVSDASPDNVWSVIKRLANENDRIKGVCFSKNYGQHAALMAGYRNCRGDIVITLDDDGQTPLEYLYDLVDAIHEDNDVVFARFTEKQKSLGRRLGSSFNRKMIEVMIDFPKEIEPNSFCAIKGFIIKEMIRYENSYPYVAGLITRTTKKIANINAVQRARKEGKSSYTLGKLISLWVNGFTAFSVKPLRIATFLGFICAAIGFIVGVVFVIMKLINPAVAVGFTTLIAVMLLIGGLQMIMLGLIGEYIGRIYISINKSPQYVVREEINTGKETEKVEI